MRYLIKLSVTICILLFCAAFSNNTLAAAFVVNSTADAADASIGNGICETATAGQCTLRAAIQEANATANVGGVPDQISFSIGTGQQTIIVSGGLPTISEAVTIDATTQPAYSGTPLIVLRPSATESGSGLFFQYSTAGTSTVRGLVIRNFNFGIQIGTTGSGWVQVAGNYIGTDAAGTAAFANNVGVLIEAGANNIIGGTTVADRNVISGNSNSGVVLHAGATNNTVKGNYIGTDATGTAALSNYFGVFVDNSANNIIGGTTAADRNVISGNVNAGVYLALSTNNMVKGNYIGPDANGTFLGNNDGVYINASTNNIIGGVAAGEANIIAFNVTGVDVIEGQVTATGNSIRGNSIFGNLSNVYWNAGIDLGYDGITTNDTGDADSGPNNLQNYPTLTYDATFKAVTATLNSTASTTFNIDFYSNTANERQGKTYLGTRQLTTDGSGDGSVSATFTNPVPSGQYITATATPVAAPLDTSEFSAQLLLAGPTAAPAIISGRITTADGTPVSGATISLSGSQSGKTITDSTGFYRFSMTEAGGFYTVTPARANYRFTPASSSFSLVANKTDAVFTATADSVQTENPLDTEMYFVRQQYLDSLGREPDQDGLLYWSNEISRCGTDQSCINSRRIGVSAAFFIEQEMQQTGSFVYRLYKGTLGRRISYAEFSADRQQVTGSSNLDQSKSAFIDSFVQRAEFVQKYNNAITAESFVDALIQTMQQTSRADLSSQRGTLISSYNRGTSLNESRSLAMREAIDNESFKEAEYNPSFVLTEYFGYLKREPEEEGYKFWLNVLNNKEPGNYRGMVCSFITSAEYQQRFATIVSHSNQECR
jgi:CSLREA domain-containing protein